MSYFKEIITRIFTAGSAYINHIEGDENVPDKFILHSNYKPTGDQPEAIEKLVEGLNRGDKEQVTVKCFFAAQNLSHNRSAALFVLFRL